MSDMMSISMSLLGSENKTKDTTNAEDAASLKAQLEAARAEIEEKSKVIAMLSQRLAVWDVTATRAVEIERTRIAELEAALADGVHLSEAEARIIADIIVKDGWLGTAEDDTTRSLRDKLTPLVSPHLANHT